MMVIERNIKLLAWFNFCTDFVFFAPVAIIYFAKVTGSFTLGMTVFAVAYASSAVFEVPTGILSDRVGRKKTIVLGAIFSIACIVFYAIGRSYYLLLVGALLQGMSRSLYSGNNEALLHDTLHDIGKSNEYHKHYGRTSTMFQIALALASITGTIMVAVSFSLVMWASVIPQIFSLIIALQIIEPRSHTTKSTNVYFHLKEAINLFRSNPKLQLLTLASAIRFSLGESAFFLRSAFINTLWPLWAIGIANMITHTCSAVGYYFGGKVIDKIGSIKVLSLGIVIDRVVTLIALLLPTPASPLLMASTSITYGAGMVASNSLMQREFSEAQRATMGSLSSLVGSLAFGVSAVALGYVGDLFGPAKALIVTNILLFTPLLFYRKIFRGETKLAL